VTRVIQTEESRNEIRDQLAELTVKLTKIIDELGQNKDRIKVLNAQHTKETEKGIGRLKKFLFSLEYDLEDQPVKLGRFRGDPAALKSGVKTRPAVTTTESTAATAIAPQAKSLRASRKKKDSG